MDLSAFATLSIQQQQEAIENHVAKESRWAVDQAMAAAEEHANATLAQEEAERNENTQARGKEPRSSDNSYTTNLGQLVAKAFQGFQEQAGSTNQAGAFRVSTVFAKVRFKKITSSKIVPKAIFAVHFF